MSSDVLLDTTNLYKIYKSGNENINVETVALKGVNFKVTKGDFIAILGPSGSGKSTLINTLCGLDLPSAGEINYFINETKINIAKLSEKERDKFRLGRIAIIFQTENLLSSLTARENAELSLRFLGIKDHSIIQLVFESLGIGHRLDFKPGQLSGGEKQRVSLACAFVYNPLIIFADEPTGELDYETTEHVMDAFEKINNLGTTIVLVTHNPKVAKKAKIRYEMHDGKLRILGQTISNEKIELTEDKFGRVRIPFSWLESLEITDEIISLQSENGSLILKNSELASSSVNEFVHFDGQGRIMLPETYRQGDNQQWIVTKVDSSIQLTKKLNGKSL